MPCFWGVVKEIMLDNAIGFPYGVGDWIDFISRRVLISRG